MKKVLVVILMILTLASVCFGCFYVYKTFIVKDNYKPGQPVASANKVDSIKGYDYVLYDDSIEIYKNLYYELKEVLEAEVLDEAKYAEVVSKMFIVDFYTLFF
jgi:hypothetical protein